MTYLQDTKNRFKRRKLRKGDERGFTLIELLVVMTIIGVLSAVAVPAFMNQQKIARDTSVKSDVRNIAMNALSLTQNEPDADTYSLADLGKGTATLTVGEQTEKVQYTEGNNLNIKATDDKQGFVVCGWNPKGKKYADPHALVYNSISGGILETPAAAEDCGAFDPSKGISDGDLIAGGDGSGAGDSGEQEVIENGGDTENPNMVRPTNVEDAKVFDDMVKIIAFLEGALADKPDTKMLTYHGGWASGVKPGSPDGIVGVGHNVAGGAATITFYAGPNGASGATHTTTITLSPDVKILLNGNTAQSGWTMEAWNWKGDKYDGSDSAHTRKYDSNAGGFVN